MPKPVAMPLRTKQESSQQGLPGLQLKNSSVLLRALQLVYIWDDPKAKTSSVLIAKRTHIHIAALQNLLECLPERMEVIITEKTRTVSGIE